MRVQKLFLIFLCTSAGIAYGSGSTADGAAVHYTFKYGTGGYHAVVADINAATITPSAHMQPKLTGVWNMISQTQPIAAITGTFFAYENQRPVADLVINGEQRATGYRGSILAIDWFGKAHIVEAETKKPFDYNPYRYAMRGGVRIIDNGKISPNPRAQGFTDPAIWGSAARTAVGITKSGKLILVATRESVTLSTLGKAVQSQGATDALSFDGGGSTMLYFNGDLKISPNRNLSNLFLIEKKSPFDSEFQGYLAKMSRKQSQGAVEKIIATSGY